MGAARLFARAGLENGEVIRPHLSQILRATKYDKLSDLGKDAHGAFRGVVGRSANGNDARMEEMLIIDPPPA